MELDALSPERIAARLTTRLVGRTIHYLPRVGSTNDLAKTLARDGAPEGTLVVAEEQTAGRGRLGRTWLAPHGTSVLASVLVRPRLTPDRLAAIPMLVAVAVAEGIERATGLRADLKWPNDVLVNQKKVAGLLCEATAEYAVMGFGINVNLDPASTPGIPTSASSLAREAGSALPRLEILAEVLTALEERYLALRGDGFEPLFAAWRDRLLTLGRRVTVAAAHESWEGRAVDVDRDGALIVQRDGGRLERLLAGEVSLGYD